LKASVIDVGYNSIKLVSYSVRPDNTFFAYEQRSIHARLGEGLDQTGYLSAEPVRRAVQGLKHFRDILEIESIKQVIPVATSAVREASNQDDFLKEVYQKTGFRFRVLSGREEAIYSYRGAAAATDAKDILFFDIGGGSLEIVYAENNDIKKILSLPLGGLRLTQRYADADGSFSDKQYQKMRNEIHEILPSAEDLGLSHDTILLGVGGTVRAIATYDQARRDYPLYKLHNYEVSRDSVEKILKELESMSLAEIGETGYISGERAETIVAGSSVVEMMMLKLGYLDLTVSTHGLRDGVLAAYLENPLAYHEGRMRKRQSTRPKLEFKFEYSRNLIDALTRRRLLDSKERTILEFSAKQLFAQTEPMKPLPLFFLIVEDESVLGHRDQLIASLSVVNGIHPKTANWLFEKYRQLLKLKHRRMIKKLSALLLVIEILEQSKTAVKVRIRERNRIELLTNPGQAKNGFPMILMSQLAQDFGKYLGLPTTLKVRPSLSRESAYPSARESDT